MQLSEVLTTDLIELSLKPGHKFKVIEDLLDIALVTGNVVDRETALKDLIEREQYLSTGFENGLAVPHAKSEAVDDVIVAFGLSKDGLEFDSMDGKPTHFVFLLLSPMNTSGPHIQTLALIARNFQKPNIIVQLHEASSKEDLLQIFSEFK